MLCCAALHCIVLYCTVLHCSVHACVPALRGSARRYATGALFQAAGSLQQDVVFATGTAQQGNSCLQVRIDINNQLLCLHAVSLDVLLKRTRSAGRRVCLLCLSRAHVSSCIFQLTLGKSAGCRDPSSYKNELKASVSGFPLRVLIGIPGGPFDYKINALRGIFDIVTLAQTSLQRRNHSPLRPLPFAPRSLRWRSGLYPTDCALACLKCWKPRARGCSVGEKTRSSSCDRHAHGYSADQGDRPLLSFCAFFIVAGKKYSTEKNLQKVHFLQHIRNEERFFVLRLPKSSSTPLLHRSCRRYEASPFLASDKKK